MGEEPEPTLEARPAHLSAARLKLQRAAHDSVSHPGLKFTSLVRATPSLVAAFVLSTYLGQIRYLEVVTWLSPKTPNTQRSQSHRLVPSCNIILPHVHAYTA
jgi:hypothetical protein